MSSTFQRVVSTIAKAAILVAAMIAIPATAEAKPKRIVSNGCTAEQIQSPPAGQCIDKMEDDIINNRPTFHALYCSSTGRLLCCEYNQDGSTVDHSCEVLTMSGPKLDIFAPTTGTLAPPSSLSDPGGDAGPASPLPDDPVVLF